MEPTTTLPLMPLNELIGNPPAHLNTLQQFLLPYVDQLGIFWWFVWFVTAFVLVRFLYVHGIRRAKEDDRELYSGE